MLESIIDLEKATVEDIMIPRSDIYGIDIGEDIVSLLAILKVLLILEYRFTKII